VLVKKKLKTTKWPADAEKKRPSLEPGTVNGQQQATGGGVIEGRHETSPSDRKKEVHLIEDWTTKLEGVKRERQRVEVGGVQSHGGETRRVGQEGEVRMYGSGITNIGMPIPGDTSWRQKKSTLKLKNVGLSKTRTRLGGAVENEGKNIRTAKKQR